MTEQKMTDETGPFDRLVDIDTIPEEGVELKLDADDTEKLRIAETLDLTALGFLTAQLHLRRKAKDRVSMKGKLDAALTQDCVITLDPVQSQLSGQIDTEFWPEAQRAEFARSTEGDDAIIDMEEIAADGPDPITNGRINIGQIVFETLSTLIDPFPRREDAAIELPDNPSVTSDDIERSKNNPFVVLEKLKSGSTER